MGDPFRDARAKLRGVNKALGNEDVATILICQLMRGGDDALELLYSHSLARVAARVGVGVAASDLAPLVQLEALVAMQNCAPIDGFELGESLSRLQSELQAALSTTLQPARARAAWGRPIARALATIALHMHECPDVLQMLFGGIARHDARRVDLLVQQLEAKEAAGTADALAAAEFARALGVALALVVGRTERVGSPSYEPEGALSGAPYNTLN
jgi:hypothetical protein